MSSSSKAERSLLLGASTPNDPEEGHTFDADPSVFLLILNVLIVAVRKCNMLHWALSVSPFHGLGSWHAV